MTEDESIVLKPKELFSDAILTQNADELAKFMDQPLTAIAETITSALAAGPKTWIVMTGHIVQAILKAKLFQQVGQEIKELRAKGKIPDDFADEKHKYGFKSWVELLTIIDEETPDADRLEALKAMFYAVNKVNAKDGEQIAAYQLFQLSKELTSGEFLYLKACYEIYKEEQGHPAATGILTVQEWLKKAGTKVGHQVLGLLDRADRSLIEHDLLTSRRNADHSGIHPIDGHLTPLGISFCKTIETYRLETSSERHE